RPAPDLEALLAQVVQRMTGHIAGHQIGGELNPGEAGGDAGRQRSREQGLAQSRHAFDQHMAGGAQGDQHLVDHGLLADQRLTDFGAQGLEQLPRPVQVGGGSGH
ncbi:hypothetical protein RZS08_65635, partial [Arthrospira platensis SPKY1]|nr:hypothetical protein [Arthrospira platensis SPKY1]